MNEIWHCRDRRLSLERPAIMGILNVTPDSFSDGGHFHAVEQATAQADKMIAAGAQIIDVGGESTRPGAEAVSSKEECRRVLPLIEYLSTCNVFVSIDTTKADVAEQALSHGAHIVNDISAVSHDPDMLAVLREFKPGVVLMHKQGMPDRMQENPRYEDVVGEVKGYLGERVESLVAEGLERNSLVVDPGIGFGKTLEHNLALLRGIPELCELGVPVLIGLSRKRMFESILGRGVDERLAGSLAGLAWSVMQGAKIIRVHDVVESCDCARVLAMLQ